MGTKFVIPEILLNMDDFVSTDTVHTNLWCKEKGKAIPVTGCEGL
jgi:hypothetical protein